MHGKVAAVTTRYLGSEVIAASTGTLVQVIDAAVFDVTGGTVTLDGVALPYVAADPESDTLTLAAPVVVEEGDFLELFPALAVKVARVLLDGDDEGVEAIVAHELKASLPDGLRDDPATAETVELVRAGSWLEVVDIVGRPARQVWGDPFGNAAEMSDTGLSFYTLGPSGRYEATRLGSGQDRLGVFNAEGQIVGGVTADGRVVGQSGAIAGDFAVGGVPMLGRLWDNSPGAPQGWSERFSAGHIVTAPFSAMAPERPSGEGWGYAKVAFTARSGRSYSIRAEQTILTPGTYVVAELRATTDGTEPTLSSPRLGETFVSIPGGGVAAPAFERIFTSAADAEVIVMVANTSFSGPHTVTRATVTVADMGPQGTYGGGTYTTGRETTPPPTVREYTATWTATGFRLYDETGQPVTEGADSPRQWSWTDGDRVHTAIAFDGAATGGAHVGQSMSAALSGATLVRAEVFVANTSWLGADSGTVALGKGGAASMPLTLPSPQATVTPTVPTGAGVWIPVSTSWFSDTNRVVTLGDVDGGVQGGYFMGPADDFPPQVRLTYTR